jgi:Na+/H+ antiporter NhaD/arsenite permease-like protein
MWPSIIVFTFAYVIIATGRMHKAVAALLGGCILMATGGVPHEVAYEHIDLNVIFLLMGMMILVNAVARTGLFQCVALWLARAVGGSPVAVLVLLVAVTAVLSAFLDNVTTVLLMAPVTVLIADALELDPTLFLVFEVLGSNIGGTATLIGDPPNLLIGSRVGLSFNSFLLHLGPVVLVSLLLFAGGTWLFYRHRLYVPDDVRARLRDSRPGEAIPDRARALHVSLVLGAVVLGFFLHDALDVAPSVFALAGAMVVLLVTRDDVDEALAGIEWATLVFFIGLFILVAGLVEHGVLDGVARAVTAVTRGHFLATVLLVMWGSAAASAIVDNIPFVAAMIPVVGALVGPLAAQMGVPEAAAPDLVGRPLWWALALGACLGGNATLVGASANVVVAGVAKKHGHEITFAHFLRYGLPVSAMTLLVSSLYVYLRYFVMADLPA